MNIDSQLKAKYDGQYDNDLEEWRMLGGQGKASNIMELAKGTKVTNMLDVGSGDGSVLYWLDQSGFCSNVTAAEISESGIERIKSRNLSSVKEVVAFDGYKLPFEDDTFDLATCSHVIEHVEYPRMLLREIARVSKTQIFEVPIDFSINVDKKVDHFLGYGHINIYTPQLFRFLLKSEGFKIVHYKNFLYEKGVSNQIYKNSSMLKKMAMQVKRILWKAIPTLMNTKPNVTTVKTQKSSEKIKIMA